jgi:hypothetical protein
MQQKNRLYEFCSQLVSGDSLFIYPDNVSSKDVKEHFWLS